MIVIDTGTTPPQNKNYIHFPILHIMYNYLPLLNISEKNIIFTSKHAIYALQNNSLNLLHNNNFFVVGNTTAKLLHNIGVEENKVHIFAKCSDLIKDFQNNNIKSAIYFRGKDISQNIAKILKSQCNIEEYICYEARKNTTIPQEILQFMHNNLSILFLTHSKRSHTALLKVLQRHNLENFIPNIIQLHNSKS
jgi:uroporphyrinogen-III synthase